jgi:hypothetical protein
VLSLAPLSDLLLYTAFLTRLGATQRRGSACCRWPPHATSDRGSQVFSGTGNVIWEGQLWGGNGTGTLQVYSPAPNVLAELGALTVTDGGGPATPTLSAAFTFNCRFADCTFDGSSSTGVTDGYSWSFGDGGNASGAVVNHTFSGPGAFQVMLTVAAGSDTDQTNQSSTAARADRTCIASRRHPQRVRGSICDDSRTRPPRGTQGARQPVASFHRPRDP